MISVFSRSFKLVKESFGVLKKDKEILLFPLLGGILTIILFVTFIVSAMFFGLFSFLLTERPLSAYLLIGLIFLLFFSLSFVSIFTQAGLVTCAYIRLTGGDPKFSDGLSNASKHIKQIFLWALISATIGFLLSLLSSRRRKGVNVIGINITRNILGGAWSILTTFVVPLMIIEGKGIREALKSSAYLLKKAWGELIVGSISLNLILVLIFVPILAIPILCLYFLGFHWIWIIILGISFIFLVLTSSSLNGIFKTALYVYASSGKVPLGFSEELIKNAFVVKTPRGII